MVVEGGVIWWRAGKHSQMEVLVSFLLQHDAVMIVHSTVSYTVQRTGRVELVGHVYKRKRHASANCPIDQVGLHTLVEILHILSNNLQILC